MIFEVLKKILFFMKRIRKKSLIKKYDDTINNLKFKEELEIVFQVYLVA